MPLVWCLGSIAGPMIGGNLARPCINMPNIFQPGTIWEKYPYLLPNLFSAATCVVGVFIGILFLEETHADKKDRHDPGLALGKCIARYFSRKREDLKEDDSASETSSLLSRHESLPDYRTTENSPLLSSTPAADVEAQPLLDTDVVDNRLRASTERTEKARIPAREAFTRPVIMNIVSYGILAL